MNTLLNTLFTLFYSLLIFWAGTASIHWVAEWVQKQALETKARDLGSLEQKSQTLTGGELDF